MSTTVHKIFVGIDPDIEKSGFAIWNKTKQDLILTCLPFWELVNKLYFLNKTSDLEVRIEGGWLIKKSNWHGNSKQTKATGEKIAKSVGMNHQTGILMKEFCESKGISYSLIKPQGKLKAEAFNKITKHKGRSNQEQRDAAMLVYGL